MAFSPSADSDPFPLKYAPMEEVERLEKYQSGEYHPILIGDVFQSRCRVVHKLGYGSYSTTWLCRDYQSNTYVAVEVVTAESSAREADVLEYLDHSSPFDHSGREMIPSVKDRFFLHDPNGTHPCYVAELVMYSISGVKNGSYRRILQARTARSSLGRQVRPWEDRFEKHIQLPRQDAGIPDFNVHEEAAAMYMLRSSLSFQPEKRLTAQEIPKGRWIITTSFLIVQIHHGMYKSPRSQTGGD